MVIVSNAQREAPVKVEQMARLARSAIRRLKIRARGTFTITFINSKTIHALNRKFLRHDRPTDVLTFRYDGEPVVGEILIAPQQARAYAKSHDIPYREELARYVVHGLLHWLGHEDRTIAQRRTMRAMENDLLIRCGMKTSDRRQETSDQRPSRQRRSQVSGLRSPVSD